MNKFLLFALCLFSTSLSLNAQAIRYVKPASTGSGDGSSWDNAASDLRAVISSANAGDVVWVAAGIYRPSATPGSFTPYFSMKNKVTIYGGFAGTETSLSQRNWTLNQSIMSGDLANNDMVTGSGLNTTLANYADNCPHVISNQNLDSTAVIDGMYIQSGNTAMSGAGYVQVGGGMLNDAASPTIRNCTFRYNHCYSDGGAIGLANPAANNGATSITHCRFYQNISTDVSTSNGGAIGAIDNAGFNIYDCTFENNSATNGGAISMRRCLAVTRYAISNCLFDRNGTNNSSGSYGGGIYLFQAPLDVTSSVFYGNISQPDAGLGGGIYGDNQSVGRVTNCTFYGNVGYSFNANSNANKCRFNNCIFYNEGSSGALPTGNTVSITNNCLFTDPFFSNAANPRGADGTWGTADDGLRIRLCAPGIDAGSNAYLFPRDTAAFGGGPRILLTAVDIGAYERATRGNTTYTTSDTLLCRNQFPFVWRGKTINVPGTDTVSALDSNNCGQVFILRSAARPAQSRFDTTRAKICNGQYYTWYQLYPGVPGSNQYYNQGVYSHLLYDRFGCDSLVYLDLKVAKQSYDTVTVQTCLPYYYTYSGAQLQLSSYNVFSVPMYRGINAEGCDSFQIIKPIMPSPIPLHRVYVNAAPHGLIADGLSWAGAFYSIEDAIGNTCTNEVWVAKGEYRLPPGSMGIHLRNNIPVYGGFAGNETSVNQRNIAANPTIITGANGIGANAYHIIYNNNSGLDSTAVLDGFIIAGGNALYTANSGTYNDGNGAGIYNINVSPTIRNCVIRYNQSARNGAGLYVSGGASRFINCVFETNTAGDKGGMYLEKSRTKFRQCVMGYNEALNDGAGLYYQSDTSAFESCDFVYNTTQQFGFGAIGNASGSVVLNNCIIWGNKGGGTNGAVQPTSWLTINNSDIQDNAAGYGSNNSSLEPAFYNKYNIAGYDDTWGTADDGLRLSACTQIAGRGVNSIFTNTDKDLAGNPRIVGSLEMGAYEYQPTQAVDSIVYVKSNVVGGNRNGTSWANAFADLQDAMTIAQTCSQVREIWVATGTYKTTTSLRRKLSVNLKNNLRLYGGFAGTETSAAQRNWKVNPTIISGNLGNADSAKDNSLHIVENYNLDTTAIIDGFTLRDGYNIPDGYYDIAYSSLINGDFYKEVSGAGMLNYNSYPIIRNCLFTGNQAFLGGGMYNHIVPGSGSSGLATPTLTDCIFAGNNASKGGGIYGYNILENIDRCVFDGNTAAIGGSLFDMRGVTRINNSVFTGNNASDAVYHGRSNGLVVKNSTFFKNNVVPVGTYNNGYNFGMELAAGFEFSNSIFWGTKLTSDMSIDNSILQGSIYKNETGGLYGMGNSSDNPLFTDTLNPKGSDGIWATTDDGLTLKPCSPAINAGKNTSVVTPFDILKNNRILYGIVDQGAYESAINLTPLPVAATNNALRFDGVDDWVEINNCSAAQPVVNGGDSISIEYWFRGTNIQSAVRFQNGGDYVVAGWDNSGNASNLPTHILSNDGGTPNGLSCGPVNDNRWHHVAMTWKRNTVNGFKSYLDGVLVAQRTSSNSPLPVINNVSILGSYGGTSEFMKGTIDQVKVWKSIRTPDQVISDMCDTVSIQPNLVLYYDFNNGTVNGNNAAYSLFNNKAGSTYSGLLHNFSLTDTTSNFVNGASVSCCSGAAVLYVNAAATGLNNGQSWADAYTNLQSALQSKCTGTTQIWVAKGTYTPTYGSFREVAFNMKNGVSLLGGFNGTETTLAQRNPKLNKTVLSGDLAGNDVITGNGPILSFSNFSENSYHVVTAKGIGVNTRLDGFTISGGNASGTLYGGGGILSDSSGITIGNCIITHNYTNQFGGGLFNYRGLRDVGYPANVYNCVFTENRADAANSGVGYGGGVGDLNSNGYYTNCVFEGNYALSGGGIFFRDGGDSRLFNCTIVNNYATGQGAGFYNTLPGYSLSIDNSIVWNNTGGTDAVFGHMQGRRSDLQGFPYSGPNTDVLAANGDIFNVDPAFVNIASPKGADGIWATADDRLQLLCSSPLIDKGYYSSFSSSPAITTDIIGYPRLQKSEIDLGAYESSFELGGSNPATQPFTTNNALNFDGGNDYVEISNCNPATPLFPGGDALTIEYWFKGSYHQSAVRYQYDNSSYIVAGWNGRHILSNDGGTAGIATGNATDGLWHHVAMTWQRNTVNGFKSYLDGTLVEQRNSSDVPLPAFNTAFNLGSYNGGNEFMNGSLDEVRIWTVARTQNQLRAGMCSNLVDTAGLWQYYNFDHGAYNNNNATITTLTNVKSPGTFTGVLHGFSLAGGVSNWVNGFNTCCAAGFVTMTWTGTQSSNWNNPANWSGNILPAACTDVVIPGGTPYSLIITGTENICHRITVNTGANVSMATGAKLMVTGQ